MEEEEDVVFKNSALYEHLREAGYEDHDLCTAEVRLAHTNKPQDTTDTEEKTEAEDQRDGLKGTVSSIFADFVWDTDHRQELHQLHQKEAEGLVDLILECPLLEEEDAAYIDSFSSSLMASQGPAANNESDGIMGQVIMQMGVLGIVLAYGCFRVMHLKSQGGLSSQLMMYGFDFLSVLLTIVALLPSTLRFAWAGHILRKMRTFQREVVTLHQDVCLWHKMTKRSIRLVQEMELVNRGFTLVSDKTPVVRLEGVYDQRQCPKLRQQIIVAAKQTLLDFKSATLSLLQQFPSHVELEGASNYLARQPLSDYGPCFNVSTPDELSIATDGYSLAALKAMVELCNTHISEFLRILSLACLLREENQISFGFAWQMKVMKSAWSSIHCQYITLHRVYLLHKYLLTDESRQKENPAKQSPLSAVHITIHSLNLHLQAALRRTQAADEQLEKLVDAGETKVHAELLSRLTSDLERMKRDLEACGDCWDEGMSRLDRLAGHKTERKDAEEACRDETKQGVDLPSTEAISLMDSNPPIIHDEVFEAYTDPAEVCTDNDSSEYSKEDKERKLQEQREAVRLLKELRSVIAVRAADTRERERLALLRQNPDMQIELDDHLKSPSYVSLENCQDSTRTESCNPVPSLDAHCDSISSESLSNGEILQDMESGDNSAGPDKQAPDMTPCSQELSGYGDGNFLCSNGLESNSLDAQLGHKLAGISSGDFSFSRSVAAMAVARSHQMAHLTEDTFGGEGEVETDEND